MAVKKDEPVNESAPEREPLPQGATLLQSLANVQAQLPRIERGETAQVQTQRGGSYSYSYASYDAIMEAVQPLLTEQGLVWTTRPVRGGDGEWLLSYRLLHVATMQADEGLFPLVGFDPDRSTMQELGSAITYSRRYALSAVLNVTLEDDDDAQTSRGAATGVQAGPVQRTERAATAPQRRMINGKAAEKDIPAQALAAMVSEVAGDEPRGFDSEDAAQAWLTRAMDRLPLRLVDPLLAAIDRYEPAAPPDEQATVEQPAVQ
jgi:hypothetical protein